MTDSEQPSGSAVQTGNGAGDVESRWLRILGWSCYLGCSWTWCIGMFLPVLLLRDFGPWSFGVFAVPNVLGAAAMGWVLRRPGAAGRLRERHRGMVDLFTEVTIAFHIATLMWFATSLEANAAIPDWVGVTFLAPFVVLVPMLASRRVRIQHAVSIATWVASIVLLAGIGVAGELRVPSRAGAFPACELMPLAMVCVLGFALCPYLDRTFLWATDRLGPRDAPAAFGLGFGVFFLAMIIGTALYAGLFEVGPGLCVFAAVGSVPVSLVLAHLVLQFGFTSMVHQRAWDGPPPGAAGGAFVRGAACGLAIVVLRVLFLRTADVSYASLSVGEILYRGFMAFYGLIFPAYVWLCMIPNWSEGRTTARQRGVWLGACAAAAPFYWMGFIERQTWWLVPGVALVVAARLIPGRKSAHGVEAAGPIQATTGR